MNRIKKIIKLAKTGNITTELIKYEGRKLHTENNQFIEHNGGTTGIQDQ